MSELANGIEAFVAREVAKLTTWADNAQIAYEYESLFDVMPCESIPTGVEKERQRALAQTAALDNAF